MKKALIIFLFGCILSGCKKQNTTTQQNNTPSPLDLVRLTINDSSSNFYNFNSTSVIKASFTAPVDRNTVASDITITDNSGSSVPLNYSYAANDSMIIIQPSAAVKPLTVYTLTLSTGLKSKEGSFLKNTLKNKLVSAIDSSDKFSRISDSALLDLVQQQTFKYFWDFGHPISGLARERNTSGDIVTTGG